MKRLIISFFTVAVSVVFQPATAQSTTDESPPRWGVETEVFQPFYPMVHIIRIQATHTLTPEASPRKGDLLLGMYLRPNVAHDVVEKINEYMFTAGYRQYLWKGLHAEAKINTGYAWGTKNLIDGRDYETYTLFWECNVGYQISLYKISNTRLYLAPQFGILDNARSQQATNIGPRGGKPDTFLQGNLLLGIQF